MLIQIMTLLQSHTLDEVREVLREYRLTLGAEGDEEERERQQARARRMLVALGVPETELDQELQEWQRQRVGSGTLCSLCDG